MAAQRPLLIFDGDCGFCTASAAWVSRGWDGRPRAVAWQHLGEKGLIELGLTTEQAQDAAWWVDESNALFRGHRAIGHALMACTGWRRALGAAVVSPPLGWAAPVAYRLVARYRHRMPGGTPACRPDSG